MIEEKKINTNSQSNDEEDEWNENSIKLPEIRRNKTIKQRQFLDFNDSFRKQKEILPKVLSDRFEGKSQSDLLEIQNDDKLQGPSLNGD